MRDDFCTGAYDCPKSRRILEQGCRTLASRVAEPSYRQNPITRSLNALALLASGTPEYLPLVKKEAQWAGDYSADSFQTWYYGYVIMLLSEYVIQTGDESVMRGLTRLALEAANGQSVVGSWGHKFEKELEQHWEARGLQPQIDMVRQTIALIKADGNSPQLGSIDDL
jgi:hypothetical protein